jgi:excisionase family DNA binding protein
MVLKHTGIKRKSTAQRILNPMCPRLLPLKEAAQYLGFTVWAMREAIWAGLIPVVKLPNGRKLWVDKADLDKFIELNKTTYE